MKLQRIFSQRWRSALFCAAATALAGLLSLLTDPVSAWLERLSFDLPYLFAPAAPLQNVVYIEIDEKSYRELKQDYEKLWNRSLYTRLLDRLTQDGAKLVVFDLWLSDASFDTATDRALGEAIRRNGRTVLGVSYRSYPGVDIGGGEPIYPRDEFKDAAAGLGAFGVCSDKADGVIREIHPGYESLPALAWTAASLAGARLPDEKGRLGTRRWLSYPSTLARLKRISFCDALTQPRGVFTNSFVFLGKGPLIKLPAESGDEYPTPFRRFGGLREPGGVIQLVIFLNLLRGNWIESIPRLVLGLIVLLVGGLAGTLFSILRPRNALMAACGLVVVVFAGACAIMFVAHRWLPWMVVAGVQIPFALSWSALAFTKRLADNKLLSAGPRLRELPAGDGPTLRVAGDEANRAVSSPRVTAIPTQPPQAVVQASAGNSPAWIPPNVADHTLVRCIGSGAYGQVWLARDVIGSYHAVKFVLRQSFSSAAPFEREFHGIREFTPISRMHPGFVHILHIGRNDSAGYFFYVMELGDDETTGQTIQPETYSPKTLNRIITRHGRLPPAACLVLGLELSSALEFLHQHRLIHRDIKPSNIIFVHGKAKFADVGLVTRISAAAPHTTYLGTEGYIAPEGPGSPPADIYSLGKVLYEACMGLDRMKFPDLPTTVISQADPILLRFNQIILKACEFKAGDRYQDAQALYDDLQALGVKPER